MHQRIGLRRIGVRSIGLRLRRSLLVYSRERRYRATYRMITQSVKKKRRETNQIVVKEIRLQEVVEAARSIRLHLHPLESTNKMQW